MRSQTLAIDVIMERVPLANRWVSERWQPAAVEIVEPRAGAPAPRDLVPGTCEAMPADAGGNRWRCKGFELELHPTEAEGYFLDITAPEPSIFVMWRMFEGAIPPARPVVVTVSYNEAARFMDSGEQVDGVPMLPQVAEWMRAFVAVHYKPEPRKKRKRNDPVGDAAAAAGKLPRR